MRLVKDIKEINEDSWYLIKWHKKDSKDWIVTKFIIESNKDILKTRKEYVSSMFNTDEVNFFENKNGIMEKLATISVMIILSPLLIILFAVAILTLEPVMKVINYIYNVPFNYKTGEEISMFGIFSEELYRIIKEERVFKLSKKEVIITRL